MKSIHAWILWAAALILVLVCAFAIPFVKTAVYWIALAGIVLLFAGCIPVFRRAFGREGLESKLLGWPIFKAAGLALMVQITAGFALMAAAKICPVWAAILTEAVVLLFAVIAVTAKDAARESVTASERRVQEETAAWKQIRAKADALAAASDNAAVKKLAETLRYADPKPTPLDQSLEDMLNMLADNMDLLVLEKAQRLAEQRRTQAKQSKKR